MRRGRGRGGRWGYGGRGRGGGPVSRMDSLPWFLNNVPTITDVSLPIFTLTKDIDLLLILKVSIENKKFWCFFPSKKFASNLKNKLADNINFFNFT